MTKKGLLGMTKKGASRDAPFPAVIPNVVRNLQLRNAFGMDDWDDWDDWDD
jgi:hypothetical protein